VIAPLSFIGANLIIYWSGWNVDWKLLCLIALGYAILWASMTFGNNPNKPKLDWHPAMWLWPYLVGLGIISYLGQFNEPYALPFKTLNNYHIPFYVDLLVVAVFSLVIYYWAISLRLPVAKVNEYVSKVTAVSDVPEVTGPASLPRAGI
jgi:hypothetical protein